jgi:hypothetical protein
LKGERFFKTSGETSRENAESYSVANHVIASAAKQSIVTAHAARWIASLRSQ